MPIVRNPALLHVTGLFGWVRHNTTRSLVLLLGFMLLMQLLAMVVLFMPLLSFDPQHAPRYAWAGYASRYVPMVALASALLLALQMGWQRAQLRRDLGFQFVDNSEEPRLCALVEPLAVAAGMQAPYVGVLNSPALNGFTCFVTARAPALVFTRGIIDALDDDELQAVTACLLMHIRHNNARLITAANVFQRNMELLDRANFYKPRRYRQIAAVLLAPVLLPLYLGIALAAQLCLRLGQASRLLISSARAFLADAEAVTLTQNPAALISALRAIEGRSALPGLPPEHDALMLDGLTTGPMATHPRIAERIQAIVATTGQMALDARPRRDTRTQAATMKANPRPGTAASRAALEQVALRGTVPQAGSFKAFARVGNDLTVLGLRWDLTLALAATFCTAMVLHRGNLGGYLSQYVHVLDRPDANTQWLLDYAQSCRAAEVHALLHPKTPTQGCALSPSLIAHAAAKNIYVTPDGRVLTQSQASMLNPAELQASPGQGFSPVGTFAVMSRPARPARPAPNLAAIPLSVHEAWQRLAQGDLTPFLRLRQCGILIHPHLQAVPDQLVTWSITSEGVVQIRVAATLTSLGPNTSRIDLTINDLEPQTQLSAPGIAHTYPIAMHPALEPPLRPAIEAALGALLRGRHITRADLALPAPDTPGGVDTANICHMQRQGLEVGQHFSVTSQEVGH